jgi:hypothetical protein
MAKEPQEEVGAVAEACNPAIHLGTYVLGVDRGGIPKTLFHLAMAPLLGVQVRGIGGQPCHFQVGMRGHLVLDNDGSMRLEPIPDDDHRPGDVPLDVWQGHQNIRGPDGMRNMALVDLAGQRQANDRGQLPARARAPGAGCLPSWRPGRAGLGAQRTAGLIDEDDCRASAASLCLIRGPSRVSQAWTRASSRSRAYTAGCCGLQPRAVRRRARSWAWYSTRNSTSIRARIRRSVHRSVSKPACSAPRRSTCSRSCHGSVVRRGGRPGTRLFLKLFSSPWLRRSCIAHVLTAVRLTPIWRAMAAWER